MAWFRRRPRRRATRTDRVRDDFQHLEQFVQSRRGVEAFLEPKTTVTEVTVMLIAHDGEWTRRRVPSVEAARVLGQQARHSGLRRRPGRLSRSGCATTTSAASRPNRLTTGSPTGGRPQLRSTVGGDVLDQLQQGADGHAGAALGQVAGRLAGVVGRPGDVDVRPRQAIRDELAQERPPCSMCPARSMLALTCEMSATSESMPLRTSSGSGIGQAGSPDPVAGGLDPLAQTRRRPSRRRSACRARPPARR